LIARQDSFAELIDNSLRVARAHWRVLLPVSFVYDGLLPQLIEIAVGDEESIAVGFLVLQAMIAVGFLSAFAISHTLWDLERERRADVASALLAPWRNLRIALPVAVILSVLSMLGLLALVVPWLIVASFLFALPPVVAVERVGGFAGIRRAWAIGRGRRWRAIGVVGVITALSLLSVLVGEMAGFGPVFGRLLAAVLFSPVALFGDVAAFVYFGDLRARADSLDLEVLAQRVERGH
jgi:hypothetical protein